jgi:uncharacterized membrane protein YphA (DoxX/SURF4 family)
MVRTGLSNHNRTMRVRKKVDFRDLLRSHGMALFLRLSLGAMILLSAVPKLTDIEQNSVYLVYSYYVLPVHPVNIARLAGLMTPYVELLIGLGLILGILTRLSATGWAAMSLAYFSVKVDLIFIQGRIVPCGCFSSIFPDLLVTQSIGLDVVSILFCLQIILASRGKPLLSLWSILPESWQKSRLRYVW